MLRNSKSSISNQKEKKVPVKTILIPDQSLETENQAHKLFKSGHLIFLILKIFGYSKYSNIRIYS